MAAGFIGVACDVSEPYAQPVTVRPWVPAAHGQVGYWGVQEFTWFFLDWINEWNDEEKGLWMVEPSLHVDAGR